MYLCSQNTLCYDLSDSVSMVKTKLHNIIFTIQCHHSDEEWYPLNFELSTYNNYCNNSSSFLRV